MRPARRDGENLKHWLSRRESAFGLDAISSGVGLPKGVLVMGIAGCGKSLFIKAIAAEWRLPLIRLDMSTVWGILDTGSEPEYGVQDRRAVAPCVLWIDEIEVGDNHPRIQSPKEGPRPGCSGMFWPGCRKKRGAGFVAATANLSGDAPSRGVA